MTFSHSDWSLNSAPQTKAKQFGGKYQIAFLTDTVIMINMKVRLQFVFPILLRVWSLLVAEHALVHE